MSRVLLAVLVLLAVALGCASSGERRTVTPKVQVIVKGESRRPAVADYRVPPDAAKLAGSGGAAR